MHHFKEAGLQNLFRTNTYKFLKRTICSPVLNPGIIRQSLECKLGPTGICSRSNEVPDVVGDEEGRDLNNVLFNVTDTVIKRPDHHFLRSQKL